jgi:ketosteroid isomerase-like protein
MKKTSFSTPQDAEAAFYEALERADLEAMMEVWSEDEEVSCIHPGGPRLTGFAQVREHWAQIFKSGQRLQVRLSDQVAVSGMMFAVHSVQEIILVRGAPDMGGGMRSIVVATNVYLRSGSGWRMLLHHGSPAAAPVMRADTSSEPPKVLH